MDPRDRLDALLSSQRSSRHQELPESQRDELDELEPLLSLADDLATVRDVFPPASFADELQVQILARVRQQAVDGLPPVERGLVAGDAVLQARNGLTRDIDVDAVDAGGSAPTAPTHIVPRWPRRNGPRRSRRSSHGRAWRTGWRVWTSLAAAVVLTLCVTLFTLAANADPGGPLYSLRSWQEDARAALTTSAADRTKAHLQYATDALDALDASVAQHAPTRTYREALSRFTDEMSQAADALAQVPAGTDRDTLTAQMEALGVRGQGDLRAALPSLDWSERITTTSALGALGEPVVMVTRVSSVRTSSWATSTMPTWTLTITGSGFQSGAILLVRERPAGHVVSVTPTSVIAQLTSGEEDDLPRDIGVGNPDDTAATTSQVTGTHEDAGAGPTTTPGGDNHSLGGCGSEDDDHQPACTPTLTPTPTPPH